MALKEGCIYQGTILGCTRNKATHQQQELEVFFVSAFVNKQCKGEFSGQQLLPDVYTPSGLLNR